MKEKMKLFKYKSLYFMTMTMYFLSAMYFYFYLAPWKSRIFLDYLPTAATSISR